MTCLPASRAAFAFASTLRHFVTSERATRRNSTSRDGTFRSETRLSHLPLCKAPSCRPSLVICQPVRLDTPFFTRQTPTTSTRCLNPQSVSFTHPGCGLPTDVNLPCVRYTIHCGVSILLASLLDPDIASESSLSAAFETVWCTRPPL
jgi:hypothetical protein